MQHNARAATCTLHVDVVVGAEPPPKETDGVARTATGAGAMGSPLHVPCYEGLTTVRDLLRVAAYHAPAGLRLDRLLDAAGAELAPGKFLSEVIEHKAKVYAPPAEGSAAVAVAPATTAPAAVDDEEEADISSTAAAVGTERVPSPGLPLSPLRIPTAVALPAAAPSPAPAVPAASPCAA